MCFNAGSLKSDLLRHMRASHGAWMFAVMDQFFLYSPVMGAYTGLWAGCSERLKLEEDQGVYVWPWGRKGDLGQDVKDEYMLGRKSGLLWYWCETETKEFR